MNHTSGVYKSFFRALPFDAALEESIRFAKEQIRIETNLAVNKHVGPTKEKPFYAFGEFLCNSFVNMVHAIGTSHNFGKQKPRT